MDIYESVENSIRLHISDLKVEKNVTESDVRYAIRCVMRDNPDMFWFVHQYTFDRDNGIVYFRYRCSPKRCAIIQESIDDVVNNDLDIDYVRKFTQIEQVAYVYKWMLAYCNYNTNSAYNQTIDSFFIRRNTVCTGYAKALQYIFKLLGIESRLLFGSLNNDNAEGRHCWNLVCLDGQYYHIDVCLGDLALEDVLQKAGSSIINRHGDYNFNCFCVSTNEILRTRSIENIESLPQCDSMLTESEIERLSRIVVKKRNGTIGCNLSNTGSFADIFLCSKDKNVVLKINRCNDTHKCEEEYGYMKQLKGCKHLLQLNELYCDIEKNILAIEQSTPIIDMFCSHYYHPTYNGVLKMTNDITLGWLECQRQGIIYRDIHVCNIYKANDGRYKLGDFGNCTYNSMELTMPVGSPWFMSPETYVSGQFDERSAVYSITSVLYFVLNEMRPPFIDSNNDKEALQRKMSGERLPAPSLLQALPKSLADLFMKELFAKCCAFEPSSRVKNCQELLLIIDKLSYALKNQRTDIVLGSKNKETFIDLDRFSFAFSKNSHHKYTNGENCEHIRTNLKCSTYSEDIERRASTIYPTNLDSDFNTLATDIDKTDSLNDNNQFSNAKGTFIRDYTQDDIENYCSTMRFGENQRIHGPHTENNGFSTSISDTRPQIQNFDYAPKPKEKSNNETDIGNMDGVNLGGKRAFGKFLGRIFSLYGSKSNDIAAVDEVYASIFAPSEVRQKSHLLIQLYFHHYEDTEKITSLAHESDKNAERRDYIPLLCKLKKGDTIEATLNIYGETLLISNKKTLIWRGTFTKCSFDYFVPNDIDVDELSCIALLAVNGVPLGEMRFITKIVEQPRTLSTEIISHKYSKVFISYSHLDESKVKFLHEGLELGGIPHFFDRKYLKAGDLYPQVIHDYINSADLFILCWSENASKSEYVQKERMQALRLAYPQIQPEKAAKLRIYPIEINPYAELPVDMKDKYHFVQL